MLTDWVLIARLAREIEERLRGARVEDAGMLDDGRVGLLFRARGARSLLAIDSFESPPLLTLEEVTAPGSPLTIAAEPGFVRTLARSLQGMTLASVDARRDDRLLRLRFSARSRFGVGDEFDLYAELVPRFGNLVLIKGDRVVAAHKEFAPADNARRAVRVGAPYELPPLPAAVRTIGTPPREDGTVALEALHVYRRDGRLLAAYVTPLAGVEDAEHSREPSLLALFAELRGQRAALTGSRRLEQRRRAVSKRLEDRERKLRGELEALDRKRERAGRRDGLRSEGDRVFATLHELEPADREAAKERAAELFAEYKKLGKSVPHIAQRERSVARALESVEALRWEAERAADEDLGDVESAVAGLFARAETPRRAAAPRRRRAPLEFRTEDGSRIVVGRSPAENAEITFRVARPNDLWFHARGIPGAHVILSRGDRAEALDADVRAAAALAAFHSKAKGASAVPVDYTLRKHVRKQRAAPPGLVWYIQAKTVVVEPKATVS
ncbi:MAG TPA: NFACT RNA binding domain-containing protein [Candidatus Cybelea sp.]